MPARFTSVLLAMMLCATFIFLSGKLLAADSPAELRVMAAVSLKESLEELAKDFEKETGTKVTLALGASSMLARQIAEGAPADVFLSADEEKMNMLKDKDLLLPNMRISLLGNTLVLIVPSDAKGDAVPKEITDLSKDAVKKIAIAEPKTVPAGIYARQYLEGVKLYESLQAKLVPCENVRATMAAVENGHADAGFVYKTDTLVSKRIAVALEFPASKGGPSITYPVSVLKGARYMKSAKAFIAFIRKPSAKTIWEKRGFEVLVP